MKTTDLFKSNRSSQRLNESMEKMFGTKLDLESFDLPRLEDARNKLRTQLSQIRGNSKFNENIENEAVAQAQWMLDAINAAIAEREEFIADPHQASVEEVIEGSGGLSQETADRILSQELDLYDVMSGNTDVPEEDVAAIQAMYDDVSIDFGLHPDDDFEPILDRVYDYIEADYGQPDEGGETDDAYALASAGHGSDEDYGSFGYDEDYQAEEADDETKAAHDSGYRDASQGKKKNPYTPGSPSAKHYDDGQQSYKRHFGEDTVSEKAPPGDKYERMVKHIKAGYAKDGKLTDKEKSIAYATAWKQHNKEKNESVEQVDELKRSTVKSYAEKKKERVKDNPPETKQEVGRDLKGVKGALDRLKGVKPTSETVETGDNMTRLTEGEVQQASAIVTAKTMVDRVSRWIEELSGMENDTLLQLGDSIRDEMSAEQAKQFISQCAPAIQQALQNLKDTRETLSTGVRMLTGEEQGAEMLGGEPSGADELGGDDMGGAAEPDMMNAGDELDNLGAEDEFGASDAGAGGLEAAGREQRESVDRSNSLLRVLAG